MGFFEQQFRAQFTPREGGYGFRLWGQEILFTRDEVEGFVAERGRLWSGWTFAIYLALGVAAPLWLWRSGVDTGAVMLAGVALLILTVILVHGARIAIAAAETRVRTGADGVLPRERYTPEEYDQLVERERFAWRRPRFWLGVLFLAVCPLALYADGATIFAGFAAVSIAGLLAADAIQSYRQPALTERRRARGEPEPEKPVEDTPMQRFASAAIFSFLAVTNFDGHSDDFFYARWLWVAMALFFCWRFVERLLVSRKAQPA